MILTGEEIRRQAALGNIVIEPFSDDQINPNSYNVSLGEVIHTYESAELDSSRPNAIRSTVIPPSGLLLEPGELYLGHTAESLGSSKYVPLLFGRSSVGRLGLFIEITAPIGDIGFFGEWTLMLTPVVPLRVYAGMQIGQMMFFRSVGAIESYSGKYQGAKGPRSSELWRQLENGRASMTSKTGPRGRS